VVPVFPGLALVATTLAFNLLGDAVRDALDPRYGDVLAARGRRRAMPASTKEQGFKC